LLWQLGLPIRINQRKDDIVDEMIIDKNAITPHLYRLCDGQLATSSKANQIYKCTVHWFSTFLPNAKSVSERIRQQSPAVRHHLQHADCHAEQQDTPSQEVVAPGYWLSPPYTFFLLNDDMELNRNRQFLV
jgi:hypothetical protein